MDLSILSFHINGAITVYDSVRLHNISGYCDICCDLISQEAEAEGLSGIGG